MKQQIENTEEAVQKLKKLIKDVPICMLATRNAEGKTISRPMTTIDVDDEGNLWFFTNVFGETILDESHDNTVYLTYSHPGLNTYVHISGSSKVIIDQTKIDELWKPMLRAWFPDGKEDPKLCLLKVVTEEAQYWNSSSNKMVIFFQILKAIAKNEKYAEGEVGKLDLTKH